ncbi:putative leucine-rich repeat-containing protein DDB_G0290503 [Chrysoperla carnea]|uniref:putative leucine-rich repeat-containing protein DDB_G0290503 n=1 Tax=Chrysoperla carnea TaxID=189513 RepID=UPI001D07DBA6|nr:putative leucine-rich repeat-containing protein DDB_G0290503 [Chrysoperla carnea]
MERWQTVILEWVNCLKIADSIPDVPSIAQSNFFKGILEKLCKDDSIQELDQSMVQDRLYQFIRDSYPDYELEYDGDIATDINELTNICSLLMYYCAINSEDPSLKDPACNLLSEGSQTLYMDFLTSILHSNDVPVITRELVNSAIREACDKKKNLSKRPKSTESIRTPVRHKNSRSLLAPKIVCFTDFIQSPEAKKQKHLEYLTKEMRNIKAELATERDEKLDLHEDIKRLNEKNNKLTKDLERRQSEISQLNAKIVELEQVKIVTPVKTETTNVKLRTNLKEAEQRIEDLQTDLNEKERQNKSLTHKLTNIKKDLQMYKQASEENEIEIRKLIQEREEQALKITELTTEVIELKNILTEYKTSSISKVLSDSFTMSEPENMGVVIELQLKEIQNENDVLKQKYEQLQLENVNLQQEINISKSEIVKYREELNQAQFENSKFKSDIENYNKQAKKFEKEIIDLKQDVIMKNEKIHQLNNEKDQLEKEISNLKVELTLKNQQIEENNHHCNKLKEKLISETMKLEELNCNFNETKTKLETIQNELYLKLKQIETMESHIKSLQNSEDLAKVEYAELQRKNELELKRSQINTMEINLRNETTKIETLSKVKIEELEQTIEKIEKSFKESSTTLEKTQNELKLKCVQIETLENELKNLREETNKIENLSKDRIEKLTQNIQEIEHNFNEISSKLRDKEKDLELKCIQIETMECEIRNLKEDNTSSKEKIDDLLRNVQEKEHAFNEISGKLKATELELELKRKEMETIENTLHEEKNSSKIKIEELQRSIKEIENNFNEKSSKLNSTESELNLKLAQIESLEREIKTLQDEKNEAIENLESKSASFEDELRSQIESFENKLIHTESELNLKLAQIESLQRELKTLQDEKNVAITELRSQIEFLENELKAKVNQFEEIMKEKDQCYKNLERKSVNNLAMVEVLNKQVMKLQPMIDEKDGEIVSLSRQLEESKNMLKQDKLLLRDQEKKLNEYNSICDSKSAFINKLESQLSHLGKNFKESESRLSEKNKTINNLEIIISNYDTEITDLKRQLDENDRHIMNLNVHEEELIREYEKEINQCNATIKTLKSSIVELENLIKQSQSEKDQFSQNNQSMIANFEQLENEKTALNDELRVQKKNLENLQDKFDLMCLDCNSIKEANEKLLKENKNLATQITEMETKNVELNNELCKFKIESGDFLNGKLELMTQLEKVQESLTQQLEVNKQLNTEKLSKINELSDKNYSKAISQLEKEIDLEKNLNKVLIGEKEKLSKTITELEDKINAGLTATNECRIEELLLKQQQLKDELQERENKFLELEKEFNKASGQLSTNAEKITSLKADYEVVVTEKELYRKDLMEMQSQIKNIVEEKSRLKEENKQLEKTVDELKMKHAQFSEFNDLGNENTELQAQISRIHEQNEVLTRQYESVKLELNESQEFTKKIIADNDNLVEKKSEIENKNMELNNELLQTKKELLIVKETCCDLENRYKSFMDENELKIKQLEEQVQFNKLKSDDFKKQYEQSQKDLEMLQESTNTEKKHYEVLINEKEQKIKELTDDLQRYKDRIDLIELEKMKNQDKCTDIENKYIEKLTNQEKLTEKLQRIEIEKNENEKVIDKKDRFIKDLEMITSTLKEEHSKLAEKNVMLIKEIDILKSTLTTIQNENKTLSENLENSQQKTKKLVSEKEKELEDAQKKYKTLENKLLEIENDKMKIVVEKQQVTDELLNVKTSRDQLLTKHTDMSNQLTEYIHKNFELGKQIEKLEQHINYEKDSRSEIQQMLRKQTDISEKSQEYVKLNVELQKKIENLEKLLRIESENAMKNEKAIKDQIKTAEKEQRELQSQIDHLNHENAVLKTEKENLKIEYLSPRPELIKLREAYEQVVKENSLLQYELQSVRKLMAEKESQLNESEKLKDAYEKIFKEGDTLKTELDIMKEKRLRDKEEYKIRMEQSTKLNEEKMRELRIDYDVKLEKMKNRMKQLYAEEIAKSEKKKEAEHEKLCKSYQKKIQEYEDYIKELQTQMWTVGDKFLGEQQSKERINKQLNDAMKRNSQIQSSRHDDNLLSCPSHESLQNVGRESIIFREKTTVPLDALFATQSRDSFNPTKPEKRDSYLSIGNDKSKRPVSFIVSLPSKSGREKKANRVGPIEQEFKEPNNDQPMRGKRLPRNSVPATLGGGQGLHMEDEEVEMFNTNYLSDLQSGRCSVASARPSSPTKGSSKTDKSRLSELQVRNSLCPPHLKSSYPAETQFHSPSKFKEDDLKTGNVHLDDSLNTCLLPDEKPRRKESTFYKKPGPSTPSKRSSFQGSESRDVLREQNKSSEQSNTLNNRKTSTPNRLIKALFSSSNRSQSLRSADTENQPVTTPRTRRYNIFRKQR